MVIEEKKLFFKTALVVLDDNAAEKVSTRSDLNRIIVVSHSRLSLPKFSLIKSGKTGLINLKKTDEEILASFNKTTRNEIRKTENTPELKFISEAPFEEAYGLYASFERAISRTPFPKSALASCTAFLAYERDTPVSGIFVYPSKPILRIRSIFSKRVSVKDYEGYKRLSNAGRRLIYEVCLWGKRNGREGLDLSSINLENTETKNIATFKMAFNPDVVPEYTYSRTSWLYRVAEMAMGILRKFR